MYVIEVLDANVLVVVDRGGSAVRFGPLGRGVGLRRFPKNILIQSEVGWYEKLDKMNFLKLPNLFLRPLDLLGRRPARAPISICSRRSFRLSSFG